VPKDETGERESGFSYAFFVFPRFRPRPRPSVSSCESEIWPGAGISEWSFPCVDTFCMNVSHMTSFIPLARANCVFNRATSSSSSVVRPSSRAAVRSASFSCPAAAAFPDLAGGDLTRNSQSRRSSSRRGYAVTESCVVACRKIKTALDGIFLF